MTVIDWQVCWEPFRHTVCRHITYTCMMPGYQIATFPYPRPEFWKQQHWNGFMIGSPWQMDSDRLSMGVMMCRET